MKPSEYINTILRYPMFTQKEYLKNIKDYDINLEKMDKRFIDREELKDKIFNKLYDIDCLIKFETEGLETMDRDNYILDKTIKQFKKEILELLK